jgi:hypothetical protein
VSDIIIPEAPEGHHFWLHVDSYDRTRMSLRTFRKGFFGNTKVVTIAEESFYVFDHETEQHALDRTAKEVLDRFHNKTITRDLVKNLNEKANKK